MSARTLADIDEEIAAVRDAYLSSLKAEKISYSSGTTSRSLDRTPSKDLKEQLDALYDQRAQINRGSGMKSYSIIPNK